MTFGETALRLSGLTARALGWPPDAFWRATPAELIAALMPPGAASVDRALLDRLMEFDDDGR